MCGFENREINLNNKKYFRKFINSDIKSIYVRHLCGYNYHASDHKLNSMRTNMINDLKMKIHENEIITNNTKKEYKKTFFTYKIPECDDKLQIPHEHLEDINEQDLGEWVDDFRECAILCNWNENTFAQILKILIDR
ncbi:hypothetical protein DMUE_1451 [Dictyocoela muelleri]|nr:hypothetical protein DMUE_1451 [Dictyocoela muelleri]